MELGKGIGEIKVAKGWWLLLLGDKYMGVHCAFSIFVSINVNKYACLD